jgi:hypothetical protein
MNALVSSRQRRTSRGERGLMMTTNILVAQVCPSTRPGDARRPEAAVERRRLAGGPSFVAAGSAADDPIVNAVEASNVLSRSSTRTHGDTWNDSARRLVIKMAMFLPSI